MMIAIPKADASNTELLEFGRRRMSEAPLGNVYPRREDAPFAISTSSMQDQSLSFESILHRKLFEAFYDEQYFAGQSERYLGLTFNPVLKGALWKQVEVSRAHQSRLKDVCADLKLNIGDLRPERHTIYSAGIIHVWEELAAAPNSDFVICANQFTAATHQMAIYRLIEACARKLALSAIVTVGAQGAGDFQVLSEELSEKMDAL